MTISNFFPQEGLSFDDVLLLPGFTNFERQDINLETHLTKKIKLKIPFVSAPMDTVTESAMAIALGKLGGVGVIHRNLTINDQAKEIAKVKKNNLLVGAAIGVKTGYEEKIEVLIKCQTDFLVIDSAHGYTQKILTATSEIKNKYPDLEIIAGNVATYDGALALIKAGVDGLRVGMGPGAICTTRIISGMGVPQINAILETSKAAKPYGVPVIADGGIRYSGDMLKALAAGAKTLMMGSYFASAVESPGKIVTLTKNQVPQRFKDILKTNISSYQFKEYRGMGSVAAMKKGAQIKSGEEFHGKSYRDKVLVPEGVEGLVPLKGKVEDLIKQALGGIKSGMYYIGAKNLEELHQKAKFLKITQASLIESHPHDILITEPGENYGR